MELLLTIATASGSGGGQGSIFGMLFPFILVFFIMYFLLIRPQKRKETQRQEFLSTLKKDDRVVTAGGIHGVITSVKEKEVTLRIDDANNVKIKVSRSSIGRRVSGSGEDEDSDSGSLTQ